MKSKSAKSGIFSFSSSISKLADENVTVARIEAQEKAKDREAAEMARSLDNMQREKDRIFQQKQSLERDISQLRKDKRAYLCQMSERDDKRRREGNTVEYDSDADYLKEAMSDVKAEIKEKQNGLKQLLEVEAEHMTTPQKNNHSPPRQRL